jgi:hypothetical protein
LADDNIHLRELLSWKQDKCKVIEIGKSVGVAKIQCLIDSGFDTTKEFVEVWQHSHSDDRVMDLISKFKKKQGNPALTIQCWVNSFAETEDASNGDDSENVTIIN